MKKRVVSHHGFHCVRNTAVLVLSDARQFAAGGWNRRTREKKITCFISNCFAYLSPDRHIIKPHKKITEDLSTTT